MRRKSPSQLKILNDTFDLMTLMTHYSSVWHSLILSSKLPQAKAFKRWVTSEVLPSIRKRRIYEAAQWRRTAINHQNGTGRVKSTKKRDARKNISFFVGVPGLEPGKAGPESAVLPLHHTPNLIFASALLLNCGCKGTTFSRIAKTFSNFFIKILKKTTFHVSKSNKKYYLCNQIIHYNH